MEIKLTIDFQNDLKNLVEFISKDKPKAARKFKTDLLKNLKTDLKKPYNFKKSIYFDDESHRDYVFKGYTTIYEIDSKKENVYVLGVLKHKNSF